MLFCHSGIVTISEWHNSFIDMKKSFLIISSYLLLLLLVACSNNKVKYVEVWLTKADESVLFERQEPLRISNKNTDKSTITIGVNAEMQYQVVDGFGFTLTGGSARLINEMNPEARHLLLNELFGVDGNAIGVSYLRLSIGASDLSDSVFTYNDLPMGHTDPSMENFSIETELVHLVPVLKDILAINPDILIMGSPWTPPVWMKSNQHSIGGSLKPEFYDAYALYFVKYIQAMAQLGIRVDAITVQNEPLHPGNNPSLLMKASEQAAFIRQSLGPAFKKYGIDTKIVIYDHNADRIDYPLEVLADEEARSYIDGTAFHLYGGRVEDISKVHEAHPDKNLYFTEQWVGYPQNFSNDMAWHIRELIVGATRNWCRNVLEWNLAADPNLKPHTDGGCTLCLGAVTINGDNVTRNVAYYIIAHASKFVRPGSVRIWSDEVEGLPNVAFKTPDGKKVLVVLNDTPENESIKIESSEGSYVLSIESGDVVTLVW